MLFRILVKPFGSIWKLKVLCNSEKASFIRKIYRFLYNSYQFEHGSAISYKALFSGIPNLPYGTKQIIISENAKIGKNCVIFQQVSIIEDTSPHSPYIGSPVIGDNCYIYPGVKIVGGVTIGNNVRIAPNTTIVSDIPDNSYVHGALPEISDLPSDIDNKYYTYNGKHWVYFNSNKSITVEDQNLIEKLHKKFI